MYLPDLGELPFAALVDEPKDTTKDVAWKLKWTV